MLDELQLRRLQVAPRSFFYRPDPAVAVLGIEFEDWLPAFGHLLHPAIVDRLLEGRIGCSDTVL